VQPLFHYNYGINTFQIISVTIYLASVGLLFNTRAIYNNYMLEHLHKIVENVSEYIQDKSNLFHQCYTKKLKDCLSIEFLAHMSLEMFYSLLLVDKGNILFIHGKAQFTIKYSLFQNVGHFSFVVSQTSLTLTKFIGKYIQNYNTK
jgi:hypothetical protein